MSWDAWLEVDDHSVGTDWNYTHNCNAMIADVLASWDVPCEEAWWDRDGPTVWWVHLDGKSGPAGASFLRRIVERLRADAPRYREMNPSNGWGSLDSLVQVLSEMADEGEQWPSATWRTGG